MSRFEIQKTSLDSVHLIKRKPIIDRRGSLERFFCSTELSVLLSRREIKQINHTVTKPKGTVRGLHFQYPPHGETKLVTCIKGEVFDVVVDVREGSPTFLDYYSRILSEDNHETLHIPEGFAHGFQSLVDNCEMLYFHTNEYASQAEGGLNALDPALQINWPLSIAEMSDRDRGHPVSGIGFQGVET